MFVFIPNQPEGPLCIHPFLPFFSFHPLMARIKQNRILAPYPKNILSLNKHQLRSSPCCWKSINCRIYLFKTDKSVCPIIRDVHTRAVSQVSDLGAPTPFQGQNVSGGLFRSNRSRSFSVSFRLVQVSKEGMQASPFFFFSLLTVELSTAIIWRKVLWLITAISMEELTVSASLPCFYKKIWFCSRFNVSSLQQWRSYLLSENLTVVMQF